MNNFSLLFDLLAIVVLKNYTSVLKLWIVATDSSAICAQEQLNLRLVSAPDLIIIL